ncbi:MAG TPA: TonB-dependent receptor [Povalibacter sp.]|uniref:TonB-dependent receptor n=1 Tax=Povalibacter sp. TaxID=1962978 RepID=UPI002B58D38E|nr:TonB-dependent receptor [Povalibacter sp.]HMN43026.1 TonB-dependent receptor [Povalibacter sp.]
MKYSTPALRAALALALTPMMMPLATRAAEPQSPAAQTDQAEGKKGLEEVVVTANRRVENQQRVPISIAAFSGETLSDLGIKEAVDLPQITPGLSFTRTLVGVNAFLRGVGTTSSGYTTESPIATYVDGLYLPNAAAAALAFSNIERIEVLKGPQGTLYGRNTTGGLIHIITKEPESVAAFDASVSYANFDTLGATLYGSLPISDTLSANFAATYTDQAEGWGRNTFMNADAFTFKDTGVQAKLRWQPSAATTITLRGFYDKVETDQGTNTSIFPGSVGIDGTPYLGEYQVASRRLPMVEQEQYNVSLKAEFDLGSTRLTSITGYINNQSPSDNIQNGIVGNPVLGQSAVNLDGDQEAKTFSQEINLSSNPSDSALQWIGGLFYYYDDTTVQADVYGTCVGTVCAAAPLPTRTTGIPKTRSYSAYGEGTYSFTPQTRATLGLRYTSDNKTLSGLLAPLPGLPNSIPALPPTVAQHPGDPYPGNPDGIDTDVTFDKMTWKAVLAHDFTDDINAYVSYNRGFKSGGYNPIVFTNPASKPEVLDAYELGVKTELFDRRLRLNVAGFFYDYQDIQLRSTAPPAPPGGSILFNAASAQMKGVDADFVFAPTHGLSISGGLEYLDAEYDEFPSGICSAPRPIQGPVLGGAGTVPCDLSGRRPPSAPKFSYSLGVTYEIDTSIGAFAFNASDGYKASYFWEPDNRLEQDAYHLVNASVTWTAVNSRYSVQLFGRNLNDAYYFSSGSEATAGNDLYVPGAPRTYGITLRYTY